MRIVVSGTHASGKSSLISDFAASHRNYTVLGDPYDDLDTAWSAPEVFLAQWEVSVDRLVDPGLPDDVIAERGPLDFLAYLQALADLGRPSLDRPVHRTATAMGRVDLLVLLPLGDGIEVQPDEDPALREATDRALLLLSDDPDLTGGTTVVEIVGSPRTRLTQLTTAMARLSSA